MLILSAEDVRRALPPARAIAAMREAFASLALGRAQMPPRIHLKSRSAGGITLVMPARVDSHSPAADGRDAGQAALATKIVSLFDGNRDRGLARIQSAVLVLDPETGRPEALLEGAALTALRTAAAAALAADLLARREACRLAVFGAGVQARYQMEAMSVVRSLESVRIVSRTRARAEQLAAQMNAAASVSCPILVADDSASALRDADLVVTATTAAVPVFRPEEVTPGTHLSAIGSFQPEVCEIPAQTVAAARVFVDQGAAALEEAGDLIQPLRKGLITADHIRGELGELVLGKIPGRISQTDITLFKSVGLAMQDAVAARSALAAAEQLNLGQRVPW